MSDCQEFYCCHCNDSKIERTYHWMGGEYFCDPCWLRMHGLRLTPELAERIAKEICKDIPAEDRWGEPIVEEDEVVATILRVATEAGKEKT